MKCFSQLQYNRYLKIKPLWGVYVKRNIKQRQVILLLGLQWGVHMFCVVIFSCTAVFDSFSQCLASNGGHKKVPREGKEQEHSAWYSFLAPSPLPTTDSMDPTTVAGSSDSSPKLTWVILYSCSSESFSRYSFLRLNPRTHLFLYILYQIVPQYYYALYKEATSFCLFLTIPWFLYSKRWWTDDNWPSWTTVAFRRAVLCSSSICLLRKYWNCTWHFYQQAK